MLIKQDTTLLPEGIVNEVITSIDNANNELPRLNLEVSSISSLLPPWLQD